MQTLFFGDTGTVLEVTITDSGATVDISAASQRTIRLQRPDGTVVHLKANLTTDGLDGKMQFVTKSSTLNQVGLWRIQGFVKIGTGAWSSTIDQFTVRGSLKGR